MRRSRPLHEKAQGIAAVGDVQEFTLAMTANGFPWFSPKRTLPKS